jgi:signal transduction histidine kinase
MQPGGGTLSIESVLEAKVGQVGLTSRDAGAGLAEENMSKLFEPFFTTKATGLRLGLSICNDIVVHHGGRIAGESAPGQGATFTVWLPAAA